MRFYACDNSVEGSVLLFGVECWVEVCSWRKPPFFTRTTKWRTITLSTSSATIFWRRNWSRSLGWTIFTMAVGGPPFLPKFDGRLGDLPVITSQHYQFEAERIRSFVDWPLRGVSPQQLARAGFVYTGVGSLVQCFQCPARHYDWRQGDIALSVHQKCNPCCPFLQTLTCKRKPSRVRLALCAGDMLEESLIMQMHDNGITNLPTYRGVLPKHCFTGPPLSRVQFLPVYGIVEQHSICMLAFEDVTHSPNYSDMTIPPVQSSSPAHVLPVQATHESDCSAILVGSSPKPLQIYHPSDGIYKVRLQSYFVLVQYSLPLC